MNAEEATLVVNSLQTAIGAIQTSSRAILEALHLTMDGK